MTTNLQASPYIPLQRNFPNDNAQELGVELDKAYIDIAFRMNQKTIGLHSANLPSITGESWYLQGQPKKQQTLRQVYPFTAAGNIAHGINTTQIAQFTPRTCGEYTDGTNFYGAIFSSSVIIAGQVSFYITPTNIVIQADAGAPAISSGIIILEWLTIVATNS